MGLRGALVRGEDGNGGQLVGVVGGVAPRVGAGEDRWYLSFGPGDDHAYHIHLIVSSEERPGAHYSSWVLKRSAPGGRGPISCITVTPPKTSSDGSMLGL